MPPVRSLLAILLALGGPVEGLRADQAPAKDAAKVDVAALIAQLDSPDATVREEAIYGLGNLGERAEPAIPKLIEALEDHAHPGDVDDFGPVSADARWALQQIGAAAVLPLIERLRHERASARAAAARVLGGLKDRRATAPVLTLLAHEDLSVRDAAVESLGNLQDPTAFDPLLAFAQAGAMGAGLEATFLTLYACDHQRGLAAIVKMSEDADRGRREPAVRTLAQIQLPEAIDPVLKALQDPDNNVQGAAAIALQWIVPLRGFGPAEAAFAMKDAYPSVRQITLSTMLNADHPRAVELAIEGLNDRETDVQNSALYYLKRHPDGRAFDSLVHALQHASYNGVRIDAAEALGALGDVRAVDPLVEALRDQTALGRSYAAQALIRLRADKTVSDLLKLLDDPDDGVRADVATDLTFLPDPRIAPAVIKVLQHDRSSHARSGAAWGLARAKQAVATEALLTALEKDKDRSVWNAAAHALVSHADPAVIVRLEKIAKVDNTEISGLADEALQNIRQAAGLESRRPQ